MVKIASVVLSLVLVLLIQFMEAPSASPIREKDWYIKTLKTAIEDLAKLGVLDPNALKSNVQEADFDEAYEVAKNETAHQIATAKDRGSTSTDAQLSLDDEKNVFYGSLNYLLEKWASKGLIDRSFREKGKALEAKLDLQLSAVFQDARTNEGKA